MTKLIILASGGTGGHVFPAQALAEKLLDHGFKLALITDNRGNSYSGSLAKIDTYTIDSAPMSGRSKFDKFIALFKLGRGFFQARRILKKLQPDVVVGFGGYPSIPTMLAASMLPFKTVIHEQNAILGRANKFMASRVDMIATSFPVTAGIKKEDYGKIIWTGNPVRPEIALLSGKDYKAINNDDAINILVVGGSQGAAIFGEILPAALEKMPEKLKSRIFITQQVRKEQILQVKKFYKSANIECDIYSFINDMPQQLTKAHLVICRAGASTMAELTTAGKPSILVPYKYAIDDHQSANAARLCDAAGAWMIPQDNFTSDILSKRLCELFTDPHLLNIAAKSAAKQGMPEATRMLATAVSKIANITNYKNLKSNKKNYGSAAK